MADLPCLKNEDIYNVSNNVYSSEYKKIAPNYRIDLGKQKTKKEDIINPETKETEVVDVYFCDSAKDRTNIDDIMEKYDNLDDSDEYDLKKYPVILDENATKGVITEKQWEKINNEGKKFHTNQFIAPIAKRIDTIKNILWIGLCFVDNFNNQNLPVCDIGWNVKINGKDVYIDSIPVKYNLNPNKQDAIDAMKTLFCSFTDTIIYSARVAANYPIDKINDMKSRKEKMFDYEVKRIGFQVGTLAALIITIALSIAELVIEKSPANVTEVIFGGIFIIFSTTLLASSSYELDHLKTDIKIISDFADLHKVTSKYIDKFNEAEKIISPEKIEEITNKLANPLLKYSKQLDLALEIRELIDAYENTLGIEFVKDIFEEFPRYFGKNEYLQKDFDLLIKTWGKLPDLTFKPGDPDDKIRNSYIPFFSSFHKFMTYGPMTLTTSYGVTVIGYLVHYINTAKSISSSVAAAAETEKFTAEAAVQFMEKYGTINELAINHSYVQAAKRTLTQFHAIRQNITKLWGAIVRFENEAGEEVTYLFANTMDEMTYIGGAYLFSRASPTNSLQFIMPCNQFATNPRLECVSVRGFRVDIQAGLNGNQIGWNDVHPQDYVDISVSKLSTTQETAIRFPTDTMTNNGQRLIPKSKYKFVNYDAQNIEGGPNVQTAEAQYATQNNYGTEENPMFQSNNGGQDANPYDLRQANDAQPLGAQQARTETNLTRQANEDLETAVEISKKWPWSKILKIFLFVLSTILMICESYYGSKIIDPTE